MEKKVLIDLDTSDTLTEKNLVSILCYASQCGHWQIATSTEIPTLSFARKAGRERFDGVITNLTGIHDRPLPRRAGTPTVVINMHGLDVPAGFSSVNVDNRKIGSAVAEWLIAKQFPAFAYVELERRWIWSSLRRDAFRETVERAGHVCRVFSQTGDASRRDAQTELARWLRDLPKPCGVMAGCDSWGHSLLAAASRLGLKVPDKLAVVSVDNMRTLCEHSVPPLSSLDMGYFDIGWEAAHTLDRLMDGSVKGPVAVDRTSVEIVERRSSDWHPEGYRGTALAKEIIRTGACSGLSVAEVAKRSHMNRRTLERKFQEIYGRSVNSEIKRVRLEYIRETLERTSLPPEQICRLSGFSSVSHVKTLFKETYGMGMQTFRRRLASSRS